MIKIKNILLGTLTSLTVLSLNTVSVFASGTDPYNPYIPHTPVPTGLADLDTIVLVGIVLYTAGIAFIAYSKVMKNKLVK